MEKLLLKGNPRGGSERECRNQEVIITIILNCNVLHFHIFTVIQNTATWRTGSDYLNTKCTVSPLHKCLEVTRVYMKWSYWYFSTAVTAHQEGRDNTNQGMEFPKAAVWKDYKQLIPYTWMGFLARGNPSGIRNGDVKRFSWGDGGRHPGHL